MTSTKPQNVFFLQDFQFFPTTYISISHQPHIKNNSKRPSSAPPSARCTPDRWPSPLRTTRARRCAPEPVSTPRVCCPFRGPFKGGRGKESLLVKGKKEQRPWFFSVLSLLFFIVIIIIIAVLSFLISLFFLQGPACHHLGVLRSKSSTQANIRSNMYEAKKHRKTPPHLMDHGFLLGTWIICGNVPAQMLEIIQQHSWRILFFGLRSLRDRMGPKSFYVPRTQPSSEAIGLLQSIDLLMHRILMP